MSVTIRFAGNLAVAAFALLIRAVGATSAPTLFGQLPIPVPGQNNGVPGGVPGQPGGQGQRGQRGAQVPAPMPPMVVAPLATASSEVSGPAKFFETLMELKPTDDLAHFGYVTKEYFVSGTSNGQPYRTRIVVRKPADNS